MERRFIIGLSTGLVVSGACLMIPSIWQVGLGLIIIGSILLILFICPMSPVRRKWWSISDKMGVVYKKVSQYDIKVHEESFIIFIDLRPTSDIQIDSIILRVGHKSIQSDWKPKSINDMGVHILNFKRPDWVTSGCYKARVIVYTPIGFSKSKEITINVN